MKRKLRNDRTKRVPTKFGERMRATLSSKGPLFTLAYPMSPYGCWCVGTIRKYSLSTREHTTIPLRSSRNKYLRLSVLRKSKLYVCVCGCERVNVKHDLRIHSKESKCTLALHLHACICTAAHTSTSFLIRITC